MTSTKGRPRNKLQASLKERWTEQKLNQPSLNIKKHLLQWSLWKKKLKKNSLKPKTNKAQNSRVAHWRGGWRHLYHLKRFKAAARLAWRTCRNYLTTCTQRLPKGRAGVKVIADRHTRDEVKGDKLQKNIVIMVENFAVTKYLKIKQRANLPIKAFHKSFEKIPSKSEWGRKDRSAFCKQCKHNVLVQCKFKAGKTAGRIDSLICN